ncbi:MAG: hypothetical protein HFJ41_02845 [Clostridia bacterium]|nr:hypothetical protein [Clostridia bacterium]
MIKIMNKDDDYVMIYSESQEVINYLKNNTKATLEMLYEGCPAIIVRKEKGKAV